MQEEIFPLVDIDGNVIGEASRSKCHDGSKLLHPVIHLHVFNEDGEVYLQKRSSTKEIFPLLWDSSVGGHIDLGETPEIAAIREAREEIGLLDVDLKFVMKHVIETDFERELTYCYYTVSTENPCPDRDEVSEGRFWTINEIEDNLRKGVFTPNFELDFDIFLNKGLSGLVKK